VLYMLVISRIFMQYFEKNKYILTILPCLAGLSALTIAYTRLSMEPYVWYLLMTEISKCTKTKKYNIKKESKISSESLCSLANSVLNLELVYGIIVGINSLMEYERSEM
jgi:hypothetical protein